MSTAVQATKQFSPAAAQAVATKTLSGAWSGRALLKLMTELEQWDLATEAKRKRTETLWYGSAVGMGASFLLMGPVYAMTETFAVASLLFLVPLAIFIVATRWKKSLQTADLPDEVRKTLRPLLKQLSQDLHPEEKIKGTINLVGIDEARCKLRKDLPPGRFRSLKLAVFEENLFDLRLPLADGSTAVLRLDNLLHRVIRGYTSARGKRKLKTKWKKSSTVTAMLVPPERVNWEPARIQRFVDKANERLSFTEKNGVMVARLARYYKFKYGDWDSPPAVPAADIVGLLVRLVAMRPAAGGAQ